ncbi:MAG: hypothetical protein P8J27_10000 [Mariniblastus sp.]|nr:hypothetical protein [Mariniblastus sp.]
MLRVFEGLIVRIPKNFHGLSGFWLVQRSDHSHTLSEIGLPISKRPPGTGTIVKLVFVPSVLAE